MKRGLLALAGLVALLALPVVATGQSGGGAAEALRGTSLEVSLQLRVRDGEAVAITNFRFKKLEAVCDGGVTARVRGQFPRMEVNDERRFRGSLRDDDEGHVVRIKGRVSRDLNTVRGRIRARGDFGPPAQNCDSGRVHWRATASSD